uniref:protein NUCLEAR FUSION DEFECTIVE 6, mitochondrial-like n=1 Tax=Erigeron canadensis TaxID=72917 RepID=UPI001CB99996|nr:protein NUCLEAR FUSION DEFECTIVE 6, mitochondrial-like [Erigeron canadensis]
MVTAGVARSVLRSAARSSSRIAGAGARSPFRIPPTQRPSLSHRRFIFFRSPVELSCAVESLFPFHTATSAALMTSMLSIAPYSCGWTIDDS